MDLERLRHRRFKLDDNKVKQLVMAPPPSTDTNFPILGRFSAVEEPHVILDGNHRLEAALMRGDKTVRCYVQEPLVQELEATTKAAALPEGDLTAIFAQAFIDALTPKRAGWREDHPSPSPYKRKLKAMEARKSGKPELSPEARKHLDGLEGSEGGCYADGVEEHATRAATEAGRDEVTLADVNAAKSKVKQAYSAFVPVDITPVGGRTPSVFPTDGKGHMLTTLRAAQINDPELLALMVAFRGREGSPEASQAIVALLNGRSAARHAR